MGWESLDSLLLPSEAILNQSFLWPLLLLFVSLSGLLRWVTRPSLLGLPGLLTQEHGKQFPTAGSRLISRAVILKHVMPSPIHDWVACTSPLPCLVWLWGPASTACYGQRAVHERGKHLPHQEVRVKVRLAVIWDHIGPKRKMNPPLLYYLILTL